jgi:hypothetical protein
VTQDDLLDPDHAAIVGRAVTILPVPFLAWSSLGVFVVAAGAGAAFAALHGLRAWRKLRSFQRAVGGSLADVTRGVAGAEARLARAGESAARLAQARRRLQESLATTALLAAAAGDARAALRLLGYLRR